MTPTRSKSNWILALEWAALLVIVALATYLRYWRLEEVPPGFNSDEAVGAIGALTTLREGPQYSYEGQGGGGALGFYFAAASFYLFGPSIAAIRGVAAWAGVVSIFAHYWAVRELFRLMGLKRARWIAALSTLGLATSLWHISASRIAFAGIGVPFLMLPSVYFLWLGLNRSTPIAPLELRGQEPIPTPSKPRWPFIVSGVFLAGLMYIYLSGVFAAPLYALFFIAQWLAVKLAKRFNWTPHPPRPYLTSQFWNLFTTALTATILILPIAYVLLFRPELDPGANRASQAFFLNPQIHQGDPWGLLWRSITGNFAAYGVSLSWLLGQPPRLALMSPQIGLLVFLGFVLSLWRGLRGQAPYLFVLLWYVVMLLPSILSPDAIPHNLRTIGATSPTYIFAAIFIVSIFDALWRIGQRWLLPRLGGFRFSWLARGVGLALGLWLGLQLWQANQARLYSYFYIFPETNDAKAAYHVYAVEMAETINAEPNPDVAFILPRNTAAGDVFRNFTTDFLTELAQPPAAHYWVIDDERTLPADLTTAAADHSLLRVIEWKTSKHTGADPKQVIPYYLEKYGRYQGRQSFEYFNIHTYQLQVPAPDFAAGETLRSSQAAFGGQLALTGYALGDAGNVAAVTQPQAASNGQLWLRLNWQKTGPHPEPLKVSALLYSQSGQLITQVDKELISNILQVSSDDWPPDATEDTYFLIDIPPATPPGTYQLRLAVYGAESLERLPPQQAGQAVGGVNRLVELTGVTLTPAQTPVERDDLTLAAPLEQEIWPGLTLLGFETLPGQSIRTGAELGASLLWQAGDPPPAQPLQMSLVVGHPTNPVQAPQPLGEPVGLAGPDYPSAAWRPNEILRGWLTARVPPTLEPGLYALGFRLSPAGNPTETLAILPIGQVQVEGWPRSFDAPQPQVEIGATYDDKATLIGLDASAVALSPGEPLAARLYWRAEANFAEDYKVFFQLLGPDGQLYGQVDQIPGGGAYPTTGWLPGEYLTDEYTLLVSPQAPPGDYRLAIGLYHPATGQRLPVAGDVCQPDVCLLPGLTVQ